MKNTIAIPEIIISPTSNSTAAVSNQKLAEAHRRLPVNMLVNVGWSVINLAVNFWYTPFLIAGLGVAVYGLVPLANSITSYLVLLTDGFDGAMARFIMIELNQGDDRAANRTFNTTVIGSLTIFILLIPVALIVAWLTPHIFNIPAGHEGDASWLVLLTMIAFATTFFSGSFAISSFASHRFDLRLSVNAVRLALQIGSVVLLFSLLKPHLWIVGVGILGSALIALLGHHHLWRRLTPQLGFNLRLFDWARMKQMLRFSGWVLVNQVGVQLFLNIDLLVANLVFGAEMAGRYGAVLIFSALLRNLVATIGSVLEPIVFAFYAQDRIAGMARFCNLAVKFLGLVIALPIGLICGFAKPLLTLWLGPSFAALAPLLVVLVSHLCINLAVVPLFPIQEATNRVRLPGILTLVMGAVNAALAVSLALWSGWGPISIPIAGAILLSAKNTLFTPLYAAKVLRMPWHTFLPGLFNSALWFLVIAGGSYLLSTQFSLLTWPRLALAGLSITCMYAVGAYFFGIKADERALLVFELRQRFLSR